jgi:hypothetical protein
MSFHPITIGSDVFNESGPGKYSLSTTSFGDPANEVRITGGRYSTKSLSTTCVVSRVFEKDITVGSDVERRRSTVVCQITVPAGFTATELDNLILQISDFVDVSTLNRILLGES